MTKPAALPIAKSAKAKNQIMKEFRRPRGAQGYFSRNPSIIVTSSVICGLLM